MGNMTSHITANSNGTFTVTKTFLEEFASSVADEAAKKTVSQFKRVIEEREKKDNVFDKRLYNVKLLLKHYMALKEYVNNAVFELSDLDQEETAIEILDSMSNFRGSGKAELTIESIKKSVQRTAIILDHVECMFNVYKLSCYANNKEEDIRRCDVIETIYMKKYPEGSKYADIQRELLNKYALSDVRQIRRDINAAVERLTTLMFGIDGFTMFDMRKEKSRKKINSSKKDENNGDDTDC